MSIYFPEAEEIYFPKTREYFQEVVSSYSIGNYRSALVMLYSVAICDMLFKLQELKDMYNDSVAEAILKTAETSRSQNDGGSKSKWEKDFVDNIKKNTQLLDLEAYTNLSHLYDHRNFCAHPALNANYELISPSRETTVAHIKNILHDILIKPPIFIKNIVNTLTEDLKEKSAIYADEYKKLEVYLNNKYFSRMPDSMKIATLKAFWKFCFLLPEDDDCIKNLLINRKALNILIDGFTPRALSYIKENSQYFSVASDKVCLRNLIVFLSKNAAVYSVLDEDTRLQIDSVISDDVQCLALSWFKCSSIEEHFDLLKKESPLRLDTKIIGRMISHHAETGTTSKLIDFLIWYFGASRSFDAADERYEYAIEPLLNNMSSQQFIELFETINGNNQLWRRGAAYITNTTIIKHSLNVLNNDFDYSQYDHLEFDESILAKTPSSDSVTLIAVNEDHDLPF